MAQLASGVDELELRLSNLPLDELGAEEVAGVDVDVGGDPSALKKAAALLNEHVTQMIIKLDAVEVGRKCGRADSR